MRTKLPAWQAIFCSETFYRPLVSDQSMNFIMLIVILHLYSAISVAVQCCFAVKNYLDDSCTLHKIIIRQFQFNLTMLYVKLQ